MSKCVVVLVWAGSSDNKCYKSNIQSLCVWELNEVNYLAVDTCSVVILSGHCVLPAQERDIVY